MADTTGHVDVMSRIDTATLAPLVSQCLEDPDAEILDWSHRVLQQVTEPYPGPEVEFDLDDTLQKAVDDLCVMFEQRGSRGGNGRGVYRISGRARSGTGIETWSLILKIQDGSKRELFVLRDRFIDDLPDHFRIPVCYRADEFDDGTYWLWLEDVSDDIGEVWPIERFGLAARHLAHFNGAYLTGRPLPDESWMVRKPSCRWEATEDVIAELESVKAHPLIARAYTPENRLGIQRLYEDRHRFYEALSEVPNTLCHLDAQRSNLVASIEDGVDRTVAIDWGSMGIGRLGIEVAQLAVNFRSVRDVDLSHLQELNDLVYEEYLSGLREVGWDGDERQLRLGYITSMALHHGLTDFWSIRGAVYPPGYARMRLLWGDRPVEENMDRRGELIAFLLGKSDEARALIDKR